jgi:hypothetical protein
MRTKLAISAAAVLAAGAAETAATVTSSAEAAHTTQAADPCRGDEIGTLPGPPTECLLPAPPGHRLPLPRQ